MDPSRLRLYQNPKRGSHIDPFAQVSSVTMAQLAKKGNHFVCSYSIEEYSFEELVIITIGLLHEHPLDVPIALFGVP